MALTAQQMTSLLQITQAMFNATPGAVYLNELGSQLEAGNSIAMIAQALSGTELFLGRSYADNLSPSTFAETLINDLVENRVSASNKTSAINFIVSKIATDATQDQIIAEITRTLSAFSTTDPDWGAAALHFNTENINKVVNNLLADTVSTDAKAGAVTAMLTQIATGKTFGEVIVWAITTLDGIIATDPIWGNAATLFDNRVEVSHYYSVEKGGPSTNLLDLQKILTGITQDVATVATAKTAIDILLGGNAGGATIDLTKLNGTNGFRLDGIARSDDTGESVGGAGDINGDGFDDLIIGAPHNFDDFYSGASFVVFGKASGFSSTLPLSSLDGNNGFRINGVAGGDGAGQAVGSAGDINGDGFDDLVVSAALSDIPKSDTGYTYVIFGKSSGFEAVVDLSVLDGSNGFRMNLNEADLLLGWSVSSAGDVNGDDIDDLIVGAPIASTPAGAFSGNSYVIFGKTSDFNANLDLSELDGSNGFKIQGSVSGAQFGNGVSAGDINGDGFNDLIGGSYYGGTGTTYVVFGKASGFDSTIDLASLDSSTGFSIEGVSEGDEAGYSIDNAGDINGDGFEDILIGARHVDANGEDSGAAYIVFGKTSGFDSAIKLSELNGVNGFVLAGAASGDLAGRSVSTAGDFNGDGFDDLIIGAYSADPNGASSGAAYVIFGKSSAFESSINLANLRSSEGFIINGLAIGDALGKSASTAGDINKDGFDDLIIGAPFGDGVALNTGVGYVIFGRSTTPTANSGSTESIVEMVGVDSLTEII